MVSPGLGFPVLMMLRPGWLAGALYVDCFMGVGLFSNAGDAEAAEKSVVSSGNRHERSIGLQGRSPSSGYRPSADPDGLLSIR